MLKRAVYHPRSGIIPVVLVAQLSSTDDLLLYRAGNDPLWGPDLQLVGELRIGSLDGPREEQFGRVTGVAEANDGSLYVLDAQGPRISLFDKTGAFVRHVGRRGSGPGEYQHVAGIKAMPDGGLAVWDLGNARVSVFEQGGETSTFRVDVPVARATGTNLQVDTLGRFYVRVAIRSRGVAGAQIARELWLQFDRDGALLDSLPIPSENHVGPAYVLRANSTPRWPFTTSTHSYLSPHGYLVTGRNDEYSFERPIADGRMLRISRPYEAVRLRREERTQWIEATEAIGTSSPLGELEDTELPSIKPPYRYFFVDEVGRIWVSRYVDAVRRRGEKDQGGRIASIIEWNEPSVWDVFDSRGPFLGTVTTPDGARVLLARERHLWVLERLELDVPVLVKYRIVSAGW